jgi:SAM-dependent methyltransferase
LNESSSRRSARAARSIGFRVFPADSADEPHQQSKEAVMTAQDKDKIKDLRAELARVKASRDKHKARLAELARAQSVLAASNDALYDLFAQHVRAKFPTCLPTAELSNHISFRGRELGRPGDRWLMSGFICAVQVKKLLERNLPGFKPRTVLDFGCGSARTTRYLPILGGQTDLHGCDIDQAAISWLHSQPEVTGHFFYVGDTPPLPAGLPKFDLILAQSVFTHLPHELEHRWLSELSRAINPGGVIVATYHGRSFQRFIPADQRPGFESSGFAYATIHPTPGLPDYYQTSFHTEENIRACWNAYGDIVATIEHGLEGQDVAIIRSRS